MRSRLSINIGTFLVFICSLATVWLGLTKQLILYIHPRYVLITTIFGVLGVVLSLLSFINFDDHQDKIKYGRLGKVSVIATAAVVSICLLVLKPSTLTTLTADQRGLNSSDILLETSTKASDLLKARDFTKLSIKDISSLMRQTQDTAYFTGKDVKLNGFVAQDPADPDNVFFVSRFVIACCAIDATPVGVAVYSPGWQSSFDSDQWVEIGGEFKVVEGRLLVVPNSVAKISEPEQPYDY